MECFVPWKQLKVNLRTFRCWCQRVVYKNGAPLNQHASSKWYPRNRKKEGRHVNVRAHDEEFSHTHTHTHTHTYAHTTLYLSRQVSKNRTTSARNATYRASFLCFLTRAETFPFILYESRITCAMLEEFSMPYKGVSQAALCDVATIIITITFWYRQCNKYGYH